jgi:hypothetical protein
MGSASSWAATHPTMLWGFSVDCIILFSLGSSPLWRKIQFAPLSQFGSWWHFLDF